MMTIMNGVEQMIAVAAIDVPAHEVPMYVLRTSEREDKQLTIHRDATGTETLIGEIDQETVEKMTTIGPVKGTDPAIGGVQGIET